MRAISRQSDVVVAGGGYAGVAVARALRGTGLTIALVDRRPAHQLLTRLPELIAGRITPAEARVPYARILPHVTLTQAEILGIDPETRAIAFEGGVVRGRYLVVALGAVAGIPPMGPDALPTFIPRSIESTLALRDAIVTRRAAPRVAIVGAGYTGTELAGELTSWPGGRMTVTVIAEDSRLMAQGNERLAEVAQRVLGRRGVRFLFGRSVDRVTGEAVHVSTGESIAADLVVWAAPTRGAALLRASPQPAIVDGRVAVDAALGVPSYSHVFACGDNARVFDYRHGRPAASSGQLAEQEGRWLARAILADVRGKRAGEYRPRAIGEAVSLGASDGVAETLGAVVTGRAALAIKEAALARYLLRLGLRPGSLS